MVAICEHTEVAPSRQLAPGRSRKPPWRSGTTHPSLVWSSDTSVASSWPQKYLLPTPPPRPSTPSSRCSSTSHTGTATANDSGMLSTSISATANASGNSTVLRVSPRPTARSMMLATSSQVIRTRLATTLASLSQSITNVSNTRLVAQVPRTSCPCTWCPDNAGPMGQPELALPGGDGPTRGTLELCTRHALQGRASELDPPRAPDRPMLGSWRFITHVITVSDPGWRRPRENSIRRWFSVRHVICSCLFQTVVPPHRPRETP